MDKQVVGGTIKAARKAKGMTQEQLAAATGLSRTYLSDIENGRYMPSLRSVTRIAAALELDLGFLQHRGDGVA